MEAQSTYPFVAVYGSKQMSGFSFLLPRKEIMIEGADEVLPILLSQCNGYQTLEEIIAFTSKKTGHDQKELGQFVDMLLTKHILVDAPRYYELFHEVSANPMPFLRDVSEEDVATMLQAKTTLLSFPEIIRTPFEELLERRSSTRVFSGESISREEIMRLAWVMYGRIGRSDQFVKNTKIGFGTVPSGGALYSLRLFAFVLRESPLLERGIYKFNPDGIDQKGPIDEEQLLRAFRGDDSAFENAAVIFVLTCDFWQTVQKYSNRGYRFALIEAGHSAQNAYLWCAEQGLGVVEVGVFSDEELAKTLALSYPKQAPLTVLIVGRRK